ncbi:GFA family protein [Methylocystis sp.]|uniref:GFA family protein n=1 Tax=Methylocystis sp. TaxID=1911079 RepID=UPI003DA3118A
MKCRNPPRVCTSACVPVHKGSCRCGKARFEVTADIDHVRVCDCSICRKRGALNFRVDEADFRLTIPLEELSLYQWGSRTAKDYF